MQRKDSKSDDLSEDQQLRLNQLVIRLRSSFTERELTELSELPADAVSNFTAKLVENGWLSIEDRRDQGGTVKYSLTDDGLDKLLSEDARVVRRLQEQRSSTSKGGQKTVG